MPGTGDLTVVVAEWVAKAEGDLKTAVHTLKLGPECPTETVAFHAQLCHGDVHRGGRRGKRQAGPDGKDNRGGH